MSTLSTTLMGVDAVYLGDDLGDASNEYELTCEVWTKTPMEEKETDTDDCSHNSGISEKEKGGVLSPLNKGTLQKDDTDGKPNKTQQNGKTNKSRQKPSLLKN